MTKAVVLLHGFMNNAMVMKYMGKQFQKAGYKVYHFDYKSRHYSEKTLIDLDKLMHTVKESEIYMVGHSMGGLVIRNYIHNDKYKEQQVFHKIKAIVTIASPHYESVTAHSIKRNMRGFLGTAGDVGLTKPLEKWSSEIPVGCIAGVTTSKLNANFFLLFGSKKDPSDGTIFLEEAVLKNCTDSIILEGSHTGLLFKKEVSIQTINFLDELKFKK